MLMLSQKQSYFTYGYKTVLDAEGIEVSLHSWLTLYSHTYLLKPTIYKHGTHTALWIYLASYQ